MRKSFGSLGGRRRRDQEATKLSSPESSSVLSKGSAGLIIVTEYARLTEAQVKSDYLGGSNNLGP